MDNGKQSPDPRPVRWYDSKGSGGQGLICDERDGRTVAVACDEKDAPLLAAAPELLQAAKRARDFLEGLFYTYKNKPEAEVPVSLRPILHLLEDAIRKARNQ
jgi:hypothetical protein